MSTVTNLVILAILSILGYWREDWIVYIIAGAGWATYGGYYVATTNYIGIICILYGVYTVARGLALRRQ